MMNFTHLAQERYSVRAFQTRPVETEKLRKIIETVNLAPTATNAQAFHIWVVQSPDGVRKVHETTKCGFGAAAFLVLGADSETAWTRGEDKFHFAAVDAGIVGTHILFAVQEQGLGTTWVGRFDPDKLTKRFPQMKGYDLVGIFPIGYPAETEAGRPGKQHTRRKAPEEISSFI